MDNTHSLFIEVGAELEKAACGDCRHFLGIQDIIVQNSHIYVMIADLCGDFDIFLCE
jgi:hypothetical protein